MTNPSDVLDFWFENDGESDSRWFMPSQQFDDEIRQRFGDDIERALAGEYDHWAEEPRSRLALIILLDQFTRNVFRDTAKMYAGDAQALALARSGVEQGMDEELGFFERSFFYMPLEHAENRDAQARSVERFEVLAESAPERYAKSAEIVLDYALRHRKVVDRFGRFPHRNELLGRDTTNEEADFLESDDAPF